MNRTGDRSTGLRLFVRLLALAALPALLLFVFLSAVGAQEPTQGATPVATVEPTPDQDVKALVRLEVDPQAKPIPSGQEFEVRVMVDNVEHLAGFSFTISYDRKRLQPVKANAAQETPDPNVIPSTGDAPAARARGLGEFLTTSDRQKNVGMICGAPSINEKNSTVTAICNTLGPPVCLGGLSGASGSGLLGAVFFKSKGGGSTTLTLTESGLTLDDAQAPCDPVDIKVQAIPNRRQGAVVELAKNSNSGTLLIIIIGAVVVVIVGGGTGGYLWYRRRQARPSA